MDIISLVGKLPWKGSMGRRKLTDIKYVIVHHDASLAGDSYNAEHLYAQEANYHISKGWGHLGYSFRIARDGAVYQTVPYEEIGVHAGNYSYFRNSLGVCLDGDFSRQKPSEEQLNALGSLMDQLSYHTHELPGVTRKSWYAHSEVRTNPTFCPGPNIRMIIQSYRNAK